MEPFQFAAWTARVTIISSYVMILFQQRVEFQLPIFNAPKTRMKEQELLHFLRKISRKMVTGQAKDDKNDGDFLLPSCFSSIPMPSTNWY